MGQVEDKKNVVGKNSTLQEFLTEIFAFKNFWHYFLLALWYLQISCFIVGIQKSQSVELYLYGLLFRGI